MTAAALAPDHAAKLARICGMLGSAHEGERASAAAAADRLVRDRGLTWQLILGVEAAPASDLDHQDRVAFCREHAALFTDWECRFLDGVARQLARGRLLTDKQTGVLNRLYAMAVGES